jgi:hypothetical protein
MAGRELMETVPRAFLEESRVVRSGQYFSPFPVKPGLAVSRIITKFHRPCYFPDDRLLLDIPPPRAR